MRVLMTGDAVGGIWQYAVDLAHGLRAQGVEVTLAILGPGPSPGQLDAADGIPLVLLDHPLDWMAASPDAVLDAGAAVARLALTIRADVVHLHSPALAAGGAFATPVVAVCHSCVATWWDACGTGPLPDDWRWRRDLTGQGCRRVEALLAPTSAFAACTARIYDLPRPPVAIHNGRRSRPAGLPQPAAAYLFTAGRLWDRAKNLAAVDRIAARLAVPVLAAGSSEDPNGGRIELPHLQLLGRLDDAGIAAALDRRPIFLSLARYEPFGLAVLEAAQAGCPLVLADIPTFRELWNDAALFVDPDDEIATTSSIQALVADAEAQAALGAASLSRAAAYGADAMAVGVRAVYNSLLAPAAALGDAA